VTLCTYPETCWYAGDVTTWIKVSPTQAIRAKFVETHFRTCLQARQDLCACPHPQWEACVYCTNRLKLL
jgi:hypothetical protein